MSAQEICLKGALLVTLVLYLYRLFLVWPDMPNGGRCGRALIERGVLIGIITILTFLSMGMCLETCLWFLVCILLIIETVATGVTGKLRSDRSMIQLEKSPRLRRKWLRKLIKRVERSLFSAETEGEYLTISEFIVFLEKNLKEENGNFSLNYLRPSEDQSERGESDARDGEQSPDDV